jgi:ribosomal protein L16 Arg81 hydroxylase
MVIQVHPRTAPSALEKLVAPLTEQEFLELMHQRRLTLLRGANHHYAAWLGWEAFRRLIERGEYSRQSSHIRVTKESLDVPRRNWETGDTVDVDKLEYYLAKGFGLHFNHIEPYVPPLSALCDQIRSRLSEMANASLMINSGADGIFKPHYDDSDVFIVQIEGTKRWEIFGPTVTHPTDGLPTGARPQGEPLFDEVLEPGDVLVLPAGYWHHCQAGPGRSVHLGICFTPPTGWHAVRALASELLADERFRRPLTRLRGAAETAALEAELKNCLVEKVHQLNLDAFIARWRNTAS